MPPQFEQFYNDSTGVKFLIPYRNGNINVDDANKVRWDIASMKYQNAFNEYQAEQAWNRDQMAIALQNEYNSPKNQLARYIEAGLNPSMIYGQISPGLQSSAAKFNAPKAADIVNNIPGKTEKMQRVLSVINAVVGMIGQAANVAGAVEGVKNQNLQNQIIQAQLPAVKAESNWNQFLNLARFQQFHDSGAFPSGYIEGLGDFGKILFPDYYKNSSLEAKTAYQNWWNEVMAPIYQTLQTNKAESAGQNAEILEYNKEMLEAIPAPIRPYVALLLQLLTGATQAKGLVH